MRKPEQIENSDKGASRNEKVDRGDFVGPPEQHHGMGQLSGSSCN